jgi:hypothetical protein
MLETVREFADEALAQMEPGGETRARHARFFADLVEEAYSGRFERTDEWTNRLRADLDNLRAALDHLFEHDRVAYLALAGALRWWFHVDRYPRDWERLTTALDSTIAPPGTRARALVAASYEALIDGDHDAAVLHGEEAVALFQELGAAADESTALEGLFNAYRNAGNDPRMRAAAEDALRVAERADNAFVTERARASLCQVFIADEDADRAEPLARELMVEATSSSAR